MVIKSLEQRKQQKKLLFIALAILIIAVMILYFGFWQGNDSDQILIEDVSLMEDNEERTNLILEEKLKKIDLEFNFLTEKILPFLKSYGELPVEKGTTGRTNPFIPY